MIQNVKIVHAALDVSKAHLDLYSPQTGSRRYANDATGIRAMLQALNQRNIRRIEMESTGGYERLIKRKAWACGMEVCQINALRIRQFARAKGLLAKTDEIDARVIHAYAEAFERDLRLKQPPTRIQELMEAYVQRRQQVSRTLAAERCRLQQAPLPVIEALIKREITHLEKEISAIDQKLRELVESSAELKEKSETLQKIEGVGAVVSTTLLALMPELGSMNRKQAASLAGLAPMNHDSGLMRGQRHIQSGRFDVRRCLYMSVLTAIRTRKEYRARFMSLKARGKPSKVALTACMRCLIIELNTSLRTTCVDAA